MDKIILGQVPIHVQNEETRNEDVYRISGSSFAGMAGKSEIEHTVNTHVEDPERVVVYEEGQEVNVYTKQPDAAVQLAVYLNSHSGVDVSDSEAESVRNQLIQMQK
jgi:hypothetical protein